MNGKIDGVTFEASREVKLIFPDGSQVIMNKADKNSRVNIKVFAGEDEQNDARVFSESLDKYQRLRAMPIDEIDEADGARLPDSVTHAALIFENALQLLRGQW